MDNNKEFLEELIKCMEENNIPISRTDDGELLVNIDLADENGGILYPIFIKYGFFQKNQSASKNDNNGSN